MTGKLLEIALWMLVGGIVTIWLAIIGADAKILLVGAVCLAIALFILRVIVAVEGIE